MELKVNEVQLPEQITFNYEELKQEIAEKTSMYETLVYTDDQIKEAKADKANLNKLKKALNDERIRREKEYMQPFNDFKAKINEIISIIDKPVAVIDKQVKEYEEKQKQDKKSSIEELFRSIGFQSFVNLEMIFDEKWLNASTSMKKIEEAMNSEKMRIGNDIFTLSNLPEFSFEATEIYKNTLDINKALNEGRRLSEIQKRKAEYEAAEKARAEEQARLAAEAEARKQEAVVVAEANVGGRVTPVCEVPVEVPKKQWISFKALLTVDDATALKQFFEARNIQFEAI